MLQGILSRILCLYLLRLIHITVESANLTLEDLEAWKRSCAYYDLKQELDCDKYSPQFTQIPFIPTALRPEIKHLQIRNQLNFTRIPSNGFESLKNLETIDIDSTGVTAVESRGFYGLENLKSVYLKNNPSLRNFTWLSFSSSSKHFETLDLDQSLPDCSCNLRWLATWRLLSNSSEKGISISVPGSPSKNTVTPWAVNHMPKSIKGGYKCRSDNGRKLSLTEYFALPGICDKSEPKLEMRFHPTKRMKETADIFRDIQPKYIKCSITGVKATSPLRRNIEIAITARELTMEEVSLSNDTNSVATEITEPEKAFGWATCTLSRPLDYSPEPIAEIKTVISSGKPLISRLEGHAVNSNVFKHCYYDILSYPPANIEWYFNNSTKPLDQTSKGPEALRKFQSCGTKGATCGLADSDRPFYYQDGEMIVRDFRSLSGNYTLEACNTFGCSRKVCPLIWDTVTLATTKITAASAKQSTKTLPWWLISTLIVISVGFSLCCTLIVIIQLYYRRRVKKKGDELISVRFGDLSQRMNLLQSAPVEFEQNYLYQSTESGSLSPTTVSLIQGARLRLLSEIGEGCFSTVHKGELIVKDGEHGNIPRKIHPDPSVAAHFVIDVAVKCPKNWHSQQVREGLVHEIGCLNTLTHPNVVQFLGVCQQRERSHVWLVFEFMELGSLRSLLQDAGGKRLRGEARSPPIPPLSELDLLNISKQISHGLAYLAANHVVHRDLATRNCLVTTGLTVKLSDFGMSRDIYYAEYYKITGQRAMPVRWMSPEALTHGVFTHAGDMWSFGVVLWEIFTLGKQPFYGYGNVEVIAKVQNQESLSPPEDCDTNLQNLMRDCWTFEPSQRPKASTVAGVLETLYTAKLRAQESSSLPPAS